MHKLTATCLVMFVLLGLFASITAVTAQSGLSYTFINAGYDVSTSGSNTLRVSMTYTSGRINTATIAPGGNLIVNDGRLASVSWNFSSPLNLTRSIEFLPTDGSSGNQQTFRLFSASQDFVVGVYTFNVMDYTGSVQYLEVSTAGYLVERRNIALMGSADFSLFQGGYYSITAIGSLGSYSQSFIAGNIYNTNFIILSGSFAEYNAPGGNQRVFSASRDENGSITIYFNDPERRGYFNFTIYTHLGNDLVSVYDGVSVFNQQYPVRFVWSDAEHRTEYTIKAYHYSNDNVLLGSWIVDISTFTSNTNPFTALLAPFMVPVETLPGSAVLPTGFDAAQIPAAVIIGLILAIFSWKNHGIGLLLSWGIALVLVTLGWFIVSLPAFGFALVFSVLVLIGEAKRTEREL